MGRILLIRHGQASVLSQNYDQLSDIGKKQSHKLQTFFQQKNMRPHQIYSGPLERQKDTAQIAFDHLFRNGYELKINDKLREHEGFKVVKSVIPRLIEEDPEIRKIANQEVNHRQDRIKSYMRMFEIISTRWIQDKLDYEKDKFESWASFKSRAENSFHELLNGIKKGETAVIFSSGGPISVSIGSLLGLNDLKTLHLSWAIQNASISEILVNQRHATLKSFNTIPHLQEEELITLV